MKIVNLTQTQYRNYSNVHSKRNFGQTIEYSMLARNFGKKKLFLGLLDDNDNVHAAALLIINNISPMVKEAIAPNGFLIDYNDFDLVRIFTEELKLYLKREGVTYLITNPMYKQKVYNKKNVVILDNDRVTNNLIRLDYKSLGYTNDFEKYDIIIESNDSLFDIYNGFNRNTKRNIKDALNIGVKLIKGSPKDISKAYEIFKKKVNKNLSYYENLQRVYNSNDNQMNIFFATLNPHTYLVKSKELYEKEAEKNEKIHEKIRNNHGKVDERLLNKKITSDSTLEKYKLLLNHAISLNQVYKDDIIIGTSIVIKNNHEVYFLIDGYNEEYRTIHSTHVLKWAIIKKYFNEGYRIFNLGEIYNRYYEKGNKYDGIYKYKIGFGGNIVEYPTELLLVINKPVYAIYSKLKKKS